MSTILGELKINDLYRQKNIFCGLMSRLKIISKEISNEREVKERHDVKLFERLAVDRIRETLDNHGKF